MSKMSEGLKALYTGEKALQNQIMLFSICGITGLFNGYIASEIQNLNEITLMQKLFSFASAILFAYLFTGYEIQFLRARKIPDFDAETFQIMKNPIPFSVFLIGIPLTIASLFTEYQYSAFILEAILAVPLTMLQAGFSYNLDSNNATLLFKKFKFLNYLSLFLKRLWVILVSYIITFVIIFLIFFFVGVIIAFIFKGDINNIVMTISSQQNVIIKLSNYITGILLVYILSLGTLIWDYELIKTYEKQI